MKRVDRIVFVNKTHIKHIEYDYKGKMTIEYHDNKTQYYANYEDTGAIERLYNNIIHSLSNDTDIHEFV